MSEKIFAPNEGYKESSTNQLWLGLITRNIIKQSSTTIGTSATALPASPLSKRRSMFIFNNSTSGQILYIGNSSVTTSDGFPIYPRGNMQINIEDSVVIYGIASASGAIILCLEGA